jgi:predicted Zn finger-like uncharacterized protein
MVISCPECSTRFRVDEGKIPAQGARIRCARCKHIFTVTPPAPEPENPIEEFIPSEEPQETEPDESALADEPTQVDEPVFSEKKSSTDDDFGFDDIDSSDIGSGANDELDPSAFDDDATVSDDDDFTFGGDYGNVSLGEEADDTEEDEPFSFGDPVPASTQQKPDIKQEQFSFTPTQQPTTEAPDPLADSFEEDPALNDISMPPSEDAFSLDDPDMAAPLQPSKSSSRSPVSVVLLFLLILTLVILAAGGFVMWKNGPAGIEQLISTLTGQTAGTELKGDINLKNLQGSFITNRKDGELFVIHGVAINNFNEAQAAIQVKGVIFDKDGNQLLQKTIFCGNPISESDLRKLPYSKMEEIMGNQFGESLANLNVTPNQSIPFTIVFRKLPKTLSEFVVEGADTKPAAQ